MVLLDNVFMMAMFVVGLLLFIASIMMSNEIDSNECGNQTVRRLNTGISTIGVILTTSSISFLVCKNTCACADEEKSANMFLGLSAMLSIAVLVLAVMINNQLSGPCDEAKKWATILTAISGTTAAFSIGLLIYRFYLEHKGLLTGGPKKEVQVLKSSVDEEAVKQQKEYDEKLAQINEENTRLAAAAAVHNQELELGKQQARLVQLKQDSHSKRTGVVTTKSSGRSASNSNAASAASTPTASGGVFGNLNRNPSFDSLLSENSMFTGLKGG